MEIYLTAVIHSKPEYLEEVSGVLKNMVVQTRKETACIKYDLHQSIDDENTFVFYEIWKNQEGLDMHNDQPYLQEFLKLAEQKLVVKPMVFLTRKL